MIIYPKLVDNEVILVRTLEVKSCLRPIIRRLTRLNNSHITITLFRIVAHVPFDPFVVAMKHFLRVEVRDAHDLAIRTYNNILHSILLTRVKSSEFNPEVCTIVSLLELVVVGDSPVVEITYHEDVFRRSRFASCICTKGYFARVFLIIVNTIQNPRRAVCLGRIIWHAGKDRGSGCFLARNSRKLNVIVALFSESVDVG